MNIPILFELYKKVQQKDKNAEDMLISLHKQYFGDMWINSTPRGQCNIYRKMLHSMYNQLYVKLK